MIVANETTNTSELELEAIDYFVRFMSLLGMPRSVGEIYGLLYFSPNPLSMDVTAAKLGISIGSASQGLRTLRSLKAVKVTYVLGDRREYYIAEAGFRHLLSTFIKEEIMPHLESGKDRIDRMEEILGHANEEYDGDFCRLRIEKLKRLQKASSRLLPTLAGLLKL